jgi:hypothetical protein
LQMTSTVELTPLRLFLKTGVASCKLSRNATYIFPLQRLLYVLDLLSYLVGYRHREAYQPVHIALPPCLHSLHLTQYVASVHSSAHIRSWVESYQGVPIS